jgi:hypothetical protein
MLLFKAIFFRHCWFQSIGKSNCGATTLSIMAFSIILNKMRHSAQCHLDERHNIVILTFTYKPYMLNVIILSNLAHVFVPG